MREIKKIIIHCSDSEWGDAEIINKWHKQKGWDEIGYHFVILNGSSKTSKEYDNALDGKIEKGRDVEKPGAHCYGHNAHTLSICFIGKNKFTGKQLFTSFPFLVKDLMEKNGLTKEDVYPHHVFNKDKTCPNLTVSYIRRLL